MITFSCPTCGKKFSVKDKLAGRKGKCKSCNGNIRVPSESDKKSEKIIIELDTMVANDEPQEKGEPLVAETNGDKEKIVIRIGETLPTELSASSSGNASSPKVTQTVHEGTEGRGGAARQQGVGARSTQGRRLSPRMRRLQSDADQVATVFVDHRPIRILARDGDPPERYEIEYNVKGLQQGNFGNDPMVREQHIVEIQLTREYPRESPKCKMLTPVFHPNIDPSMICIGDHWTAGERLVDLVIRIGEMLSYQDFNIQSPLDGAAAMWADNNRDRFPIDNVNCFPERYDEIFNRN